MLEPHDFTCEDFVKHVKEPITERLSERNSLRPFT
jgi:hypothetical protein